MNSTLQALLSASETHPMIAAFGLAGAIVFVAIPYIGYKLQQRKSLAKGQAIHTEREHDLSWIGGEAYISPAHFLSEDKISP